MALDQEILGKGVYTPREAARLVGTSPQQVLRWTRGSGANEPLWTAHYQFIDEDVTEISFLDMIEVRVVTAMRYAEIPLQRIRFAMRFAQEKYGIERPFASQSFKTDGSEILMEAVEGDGEYVSLSKARPGQKVFRQIVSQSLNDLEYEDDTVARWRPQLHREIIIDPERQFGDPLIDRHGLSTKIIFEEFRNFGDVDYIASIYEVPKQAITKAIDFEKSLEAVNG